MSRRCYQALPTTNVSDERGRDSASGIPHYALFNCAITEEANAKNADTLI